jgi:NADPH-dependent ferric siderophore reductase
MQQPGTDNAGKDRFAFPLTPRVLSIDGVQPLELTVSEVRDLSPRMRSITLAGAGSAFRCTPGQDVMMVLSGGERPLSRRYSIRGFDAARDALELNIVSHGAHGPGADWVANTRVGDRINAVGPRGKIFVNETADWHLWLGDESAIAATLFMLESLPPNVQARAFLEVGTPEDELSTDSRIQWLHRGADTPAWSSEMLVDAMRSVELPTGRGHVYINGEVKVVTAVQRAALARGLDTGQLSPKAYWGRGKANAQNGEPERELRAEMDAIQAGASAG